MLVAVTAMRELVESLPGMGRVKRRVERDAESA